MTRRLLGAGVLLSALAVALRAQAPPQFTVAVEYVEIEARVLDAREQPIRGLTRDQFQVIEDGAVQNVTAFAAVDLPVPATPTEPLVTASSMGGFARPDVATNVRPETDGRIFLLLVDDQKVDPSRTAEMRRFLREFVERGLGPSDRVAVSSLWRSAAFQNFTSDKALLISAIDQVFGAKLPSPTVEASRLINAGDDAAAQADVTYARVKMIEETLVKVVAWMAEGRPSNKSIVLLSEGIPPDPVNTDDPFAKVDAQMRQFALDRLAGGARLSSIPIYTIDPRGLTSLAEEAILISGPAAAALQGELEESRTPLRRLADDTGGAFVMTNDFQAAFDSIVGRASAYYVLGYHSTNPKRDGKFRRVQVKVGQPDAHVVARSGYVAEVERPARRAAQGPAASSSLVREALNSRFPMSALPMTMMAAPFRDKGSAASIAVIVEAPGSALEVTEQGGTFAAPLQVLVSALDEHGAMKATDVKDLQFKLQPAVFERVQRQGFRWLSRLTVKPGKYQIRIAAAGSTKQGSVWYELEVPDFSDGELAISGLLVVSAAHFGTPTLRPDPQLAGLPGPPTAARAFPSGDNLTVFAEVYDNKVSKTRDLDITVRVRTEHGREVFRLPTTVAGDRVRAARGVVRSVTDIPLQILPGRYVVSVEAEPRGDAEHRVIRETPFEVTR